jgi:hypothetical protein
MASIKPKIKLFFGRSSAHVCTELPGFVASTVAWQTGHENDLEDCSSFVFSTI